MFAYSYGFMYSYLILELTINTNNLLKILIINVQTKIYEKKVCLKKYLKKKQKNNNKKLLFFPPTKYTKNIIKNEIPSIYLKK